MAPESFFSQQRILTLDHAQKSPLFRSDRAPGTVLITLTTRRVICSNIITDEERLLCIPSGLESPVWFS